MDMLTWTGMGETTKASTLHKETQATKECGEWEKQFSPGKSTTTGYPIPDSSENAHISNIIKTEEYYI